MRASGLTEALVTVKTSDVRRVGDTDLIAIRKLKRTGLSP